MKNKFQKARETMARFLEKDEGLRETYRANIAMLLHDRYEITDPVQRNQAAEDVLQLVFGGR